MTTPPAFWASKVAGLLVGETSCWLSVWLPGHQAVATRPSDFDLATWKIAHTALLERTVEGLEAAGWTCRVEGANYFRVQGQAAALAGKPDIIARKGRATKVLDCKTGAPQEKHTAQVVLYCLALPLAWQQPALSLDGEVVYDTHTVAVPGARAADQRPRFIAVMRQLGSAVRPEARPSASECRFCDLTKMDCPDRIDVIAPTVTTEEF